MALYAKRNGEFPSLGASCIARYTLQPYLHKHHSRRHLFLTVPPVKWWWKWKAGPTFLMAFAHAQGSITTFVTNSVSTTNCILRCYMYDTILQIGPADQECPDATPSFKLKAPLLNLTRNIFLVPFLTCCPAEAVPHRFCREHTRAWEGSCCTDPEHRWEFP